MKNSAMKNMFRTVLLSTALLSSQAFAQSDDSGQVDLGPIASAIGVTPKVNLNFGPAMMRGFAESFRGRNAELAGIIGSVSGLRVMVFEEAGIAEARGRVAETASELSAAGWTAAMEVRDGETRVDLFLNESEKFVDGLVLMVMDGDDTAVFANVYGKLDPVVIGKLIGSGDGLSGLKLGDTTIGDVYLRFPSKSDDEKDEG